MEVKATTPANCGTITFGEPEPISECFPGDPTRTLTGTRAQGEWRPPERLLPYLPKNFSIPLDCYTGADGLRRIVPRCNFEELIDLGAVGGRAVIHGLRGFDQERENDQRLMHLIHQYVCGRRYRRMRGMQEHLTRQFEYARDLYVRRSGRHADNERDVLPDDIGLTPGGEGHRLGVAQLTKRGREAACQAHYRNPTSKSAINFGLYEAARLNPLEAENEKVPGLVKSALFDVECLGDPPSEELIGHVVRRLWKAVRAHETDSADTFYNWFAGPNNSLVKQIARQKSQPGGKLSREDVRRVLLHLAMQAFEYVGQCVHVLMRTIKLSIPQPLNEKEKELYEHMHESQPYYGGLPAAMLVDRMEDLRRAVLAIWEEPQNPEHVRVLHRLLDYYAQMAKRRRQADKQSKNRPSPIQPEPSQKTDNSNGVECDAQKAIVAKSDSPAKKSSTFGPVQLIENVHSVESDEEDPFAIIADRIRQLRAIVCPDGCSDWKYHREGESLTGVTIRLRCECGRIDGTISMPLEEFVAHAEKALNRRRMPSADASNVEAIEDDES
jgi:hypothetical protein